MSTERRRKFSTWKTCLIALAGLLVTASVIAIALIPRINSIFENVRMADCAWGSSTQVWMDDNRNGEWDADEQPFANVKFYVDDVKNGHPRMSAGTSDTDGNARLYIFIAGCPEVAMEFYPEPPAGYCFTTSERVQSEDEPPHQFGLALCL
jgi:hypothetical protein